MAIIISSEILINANKYKLILHSIVTHNKYYVRIINQYDILVDPMLIKLGYEVSRALNPINA